jgi:thiol-disulfide isomerase/thioredoxin
MKQFIQSIPSFYQSLIKKPKEHLVAIFAHIDAIVAILALVFCVAFPNKQTFAYQSDHSADPYSIGFHQLKQETKSTPLNEVGKTTIYVLYKDTCKVCKEYQDEIIQMMDELKADKDTKIDVYYVNATKEQPKWLFKNLAISLGKEIKTPYVIELRADLHTGSQLDKIKYYPIVRGRLDSKDVIKKAKLHLLSGAKVQESQISELTNLSYID